jgi:flagellar hook protein FlgE
VNDGSQNHYTRDGSFDVATDGTLVNPATGMKVQGWMANELGQVDTTKPLGEISIPFGATMAGQQSQDITVRGNVDADLNGYGDVAQSNASAGVGSASGVYTAAATTNYVVRIATVNAATGEVTGIQVSTDGGATFGGTVAAAGGAPSVIGSGLSFAIATSTNNTVGNSYSFTASSPVVTTSVNMYDSLGTAHSVTLTFTKTGANSWTWQPTTTEAGVTFAPATATAFTFSGNGVYTGTQPAGTISLTLTSGANTPATMDFDLSHLSQLAGSSEVHATADGAPGGTLVSFSLDQSGEVVGVYSNGISKNIGQIALATFANATGLMKSGKNLYDQSANSGDAAVGAPGAGGRGTVASGYLEMSNVDLALQFTNMIMAERGFQANARVITTSDEMLQDLVNLKR